MLLVRKREKVLPDFFDELYHFETYPNSFRQFWPTCKECNGQQHKCKHLRRRV